MIPRFLNPFPRWRENPTRERFPVSRRNFIHGRGIRTITGILTEREGIAGMHSPEALLSKQPGVRIRQRSAT